MGRCVRNASTSAYATPPYVLASRATFSRFAPQTAAISTPGMARAARACVSLMFPAPSRPTRMPGLLRCVRSDPANLDVAVPDLVAVILQQDVPVLELAEALDVLELALRDGRAELRTVERIPQH